MVYISTPAQIYSKKIENETRVHKNISAIKIVWKINLRSPAWLRHPILLTVFKALLSFPEYNFIFYRSRFFPEGVSIYLIFLSWICNMMFCKKKIGDSNKTTKQKEGRQRISRKNQLTIAFKDSDSQENLKRFRSTTFSLSRPHVQQPQNYAKWHLICSFT